MTSYPDLVSNVERNLGASRFSVSRNVTLPRGTPVDLAASRTHFSWKGLVILSQHILLRHLPRATVSDFHTFFDEGFLYAKRVNRIPLLRGMQLGYMVTPVIAVDAVTPEIVSFVTSCPQKHWSLFEFPVLHDLSTGQIYFYQGTAMWGAFFFSDMRSMAKIALTGN